MDWSKFLSVDEQQQIEEVLKQGGTDKLKPIKEQLPAHISYFQIKIALVLFARKQKI